MLIIANVTVQSAKQGTCGKTSTHKAEYFGRWAMTLPSSRTCCFRLMVQSKHKQTTSYVLLQYPMHIFHIHTMMKHCRSAACAPQKPAARHECATLKSACHMPATLVRAWAKNGDKNRQQIVGHKMAGANTQDVA